MSLNGAVRKAQEILGPQATRFAMRLVGPSGTQLFRELLGRSARHRVQVRVPTEFLGEPTDGWNIRSDVLTASSIVYSLGIGNTITFDLALIRRFGCKVFAFDPTPEALLWLGHQQLPPELQVIPYGVADFDGSARFFEYDGVQFTQQKLHSEGRATEPLEVHRLPTIMRELGHSKIDLLKINIEGGEYAVINDVVGSGIVVGQLVVEFHHRFQGYRLWQTERAVQQLTDAGYQIFSIAYGKEYSFTNREKAAP
jgi:FkbM family methyltransferase